MYCIEAVEEISFVLKFNQQQLINIPFFSLRVKCKFIGSTDHLRQSKNKVVFIKSQKFNIHLRSILFVIYLEKYSFNY